MILEGISLISIIVQHICERIRYAISACRQDFKYMVVNKDGVNEKKRQAVFLYADDVCLMASNEVDLQISFDNISGCISDYGMKVSEKSQRWFVQM